MNIQTFVTARGCRDPFKISLPAPIEFDALRQATREVLSEDVADWQFFDESTEAELDADALAALRENSVIRLHCHPCRRVKVTVNFDCEQVELKLRPVAPLKVVLSRAVKKLGLDVEQIDQHLLTLANSNEGLPLHAPVGTLTGSEDCDVELDLVLDPAING